MRASVVLWVVLVGAVWAQDTPTRDTPIRVDSVLTVQGRTNRRALQATKDFNTDLLLAVSNTNDDNYISNDEVRNFFASLDTNKNNNVERCEFVTYYNQTLNLTAPVATFLYNNDNNATNDNNGNIVFAYDEIQPGSIPLSVMRRAVYEAVYNAGLLAYDHRDIIVATDPSVLPASGVDLAVLMDANKDGIISTDEVSNAFNGLDADGNGEITRCELSASEGSQGAGSSPAGDLGFDVIDKNRNGVITREEFMNDLRTPDGTGFQNLTREQYGKHLQQRMDFTRQKSGLPIALPDYKCEWMNKPLGIDPPSFDAKLFVADADSNYDDVITQQEFTNALVTYADTNYDGMLSACEFVERAEARYNVTKRDAIAIYQALTYDVTTADYNNDGQTTTCELYLFMIYLTGKAESFATRQASVEAELERERQMEERWRMPSGGFEFSLFRPQHSFFDLFSPFGLKK